MARGKVSREKIQKILDNPSFGSTKHCKQVFTTLNKLPREKTENYLDVMLEIFDIIFLDLKCKNEYHKSSALNLLGKHIKYLSKIVFFSNQINFKLFNPFLTKLLFIIDSNLQDTEVSCELVKCFYRIFQKTLIVSKESRKKVLKFISFKDDDYKNKKFVLLCIEFYRLLMKEKELKYMIFEFNIIETLVNCMKLVLFLAKEKEKFSKEIVVVVGTKKKKRKSKTEIWCYNEIEEVNEIILILLKKIVSKRSYSFKHQFFLKCKRQKINEFEFESIEGSEGVQKSSKTTVVDSEITKKKKSEVNKELEDEFMDFNNYFVTVEEKDKYSTKYKMLNEMGFYREDLNGYVLKKYKGDMEKCVKGLIKFQKFSEKKKNLISKCYYEVFLKCFNVYFKQLLEKRYFKSTPVNIVYILYLMQKQKESKKEKKDECIEEFVFEPTNETDDVVSEEEIMEKEWELFVKNKNKTKLIDCGEDEREFQKLFLFFQDYLTCFLQNKEKKINFIIIKSFRKLLQHFGKFKLQTLGEKEFQNIFLLLNQFKQFYSKKFEEGNIPLKKRNEIISCFSKLFISFIHILPLKYLVIYFSLNSSTSNLFSKIFYFEKYNNYFIYIEIIYKLRNEKKLLREVILPNFFSQVNKQIKITTNRNIFFAKNTTYEINGILQSFGIIFSIVNPSLLIKYYSAIKILILHFWKNARFTCGCEIIIVFKNIVLNLQKDILVYFFEILDIFKLNFSKNNERIIFIDSKDQVKSEKEIKIYLSQLLFLSLNFFSEILNHSNIIVKILKEDTNAFVYFFRQLCKNIKKHSEDLKLFEIELSMKLITKVSVKKKIFKENELVDFFRIILSQLVDSYKDRKTIENSTIRILIHFLEFEKKFFLRNIIDYFGISANKKQNKKIIKEKRKLNNLQKIYERTIVSKIKNNPNVNEDTKNNVKRLSGYLKKIIGE